MARRIKELAANRGVRNGLWMYLLQAFNTIIPLLTLPYVTRVLGAEGYGYFSIAFNIIGYYQVLVDYGFDMSATRKVAIGKDSLAVLDKSFSCVLTCRIVLLLVCCAVSIPYCLLNDPFSLQSSCLAVMLVSVLGSALQQTWVFQGMQDMKYISLANISGRIVSTACVFLFVCSQSDILLYCLLYSISPVISGLFGIILTGLKYGVRFHICKLTDLAKEFRDGFFVFTTQLSSKVFSSIGITILGLMSTPDVVGIYSAIHKIPNVMTLAWSPISQVLYPISSRHMSRGVEEGLAFVTRMRVLFLSIFGALALMISLTSKTVVSFLYGDAYAAYSYWVVPLLAWLVVGINNNFLGIQTLLACGRDKEYSRCFQVGVIATVILNFALIALFGGTGAAVAPLLSELVLSILLSRSVSRMKSQLSRAQDEPKL